jgi:gliding motility-associated-like protein
MNRLKKLLHIFLTAAACLFACTIQAQANFEFVENKGQWDSRVQLKGAFTSGAFFLREKGFTVLLHNPYDLQKMVHDHHGNSAKNTSANNALSASRPGDEGPEGIRTDSGNILHSHAYNVDFLGATPGLKAQPDKLQDSYNNYFLGSDKSKWAANCKIYKAVNYKNLYPGIDIRYYSDNGTLKYDLLVSPGADVNAIAMQYEGVDKLSIKNNELIIATSVGDVKELYPYSYQFDKITGKKEVPCKFEIVNGNIVKFKIKNYDKTQPLVIDPTLVFSTFNGSPANNYGFTATPGADGTFYSGCSVRETGYPTTPGAFQTVFGGGAGQNGVSDIGIMKFNATGTARIYSTYIGGSNNEYPHSIIADGAGNLVILGRTYSANYPRTVPVVGTGGGGDILVTKLNATGTALIGSMVIGGNGLDGTNIKDPQNGASSNPQSIHRFYGDDSRSEVNLDNAGNILVAAQTQSDNFPVTAGVFQATKGALQDGMIMKINANCNALIFASFLGGAGDDGAFVIAQPKGGGNYFVAGGTTSNNFPGNKTGVITPAFAGGTTDGFIAEISSDGASIIRSTYLGTAGIDIIYGLQFDKFGFPYVMGITSGAWPVVNATYSNPNSSQFIAKLKPDLSAYEYSTVYGTGTSQSNISPVAFLVDRCENVYVSGWGGWLTPDGNPYNQAGVVGMPVTSDAFKGSTAGSGANNTDNRDFYFIVLKKNAAGLLFGSTFGQNGGEGEHVDGGTSRFDEQGVIYMAICANCFAGSQIPITTPYPITPGVVGPTNLSGAAGCNLGAAKIAFNFAGVGAGVRSFIQGTLDTSGCVPLNVIFRDTVRNAQTYEWDFDGDGITDQITNATQFEVTATYNTVGRYRVRLIAVDSTTCNVRDTSYVNIIVRNDEATLAFNAVKVGPCESLSYQFNNTSIAPAGKPFSNQSFIWDFGDGSSRLVAGTGSVTHAFPAPGTYNVRLILPDTNYCNAPDSLPLELRIAPNVKAQFQIPLANCAPFNAVFNNTSIAGQTFSWDFGDGNTSTLTNPTHLYATPGTYTIKLVARDPATCNLIDSTTTTIVVSGSPTAAFTYTPTAPVQNATHTFTNNSSPDAVRFKWLWGDGDSLSTVSRADVDHLYNSTGNFNACLVAYNQIGCPDTVCATVQTIVVPQLDVPNAFTPAGPNNNVVYVRGFGIGKMTWRIYNRFGNLVFQSASPNIGWDGKYKGVIQPMDAYAYTLDVEFTDGTKARKTGDITLLR